jgi:NlpC/P60 family putative phage cell wall peptidase
MTNTRTRIVALARAWIGTPYHHQASLRGVGTDCLGLVRGIWRELHGSEAQALPAYTRDWAEGSGRETLLEAARRHLIEIPPFDAQPGDVLVFRWRRNTLAKHCAILSKPAAMIHALEGAPVTEVTLTPWWRRHLAAAFAFPIPVIPEFRGQRNFRDPGPHMHSRSPEPWAPREESESMTPVCP